jgi:hypothetical protein
MRSSFDPHLMLLADAVEKVGFPFGVMLLGGF